MSSTIQVTLSSGPGNENIGNNNSWVEVDVPGKNDMFAQLVYVTNPTDQIDPNSPTTTTNTLLSSILVALDGVLLI